MKKATKASDNRYYQARFSAAQKNTEFESREAASDVVGIDRTRLARIELGKCNTLCRRGCIYVKMLQRS